MIFGVKNLLIMTLVIYVSVDHTASNLRISSLRHCVSLETMATTSRNIKVKFSLYKHQDMETYRDGGIAPSFLNSALEGGEWSASRIGRFTPAERAPAPIRQEAPEPVWTLWSTEKSVTPAGNRPSPVQPIAIRTKLLQCYFDSLLAGWLLCR
jgi:hypothetical protein